MGTSETNFDTKSVVVLIISFSLAAITAGFFVGSYLFPDDLSVCSEGEEVCLASFVEEHTKHYYYDRLTFVSTDLDTQPLFFQVEFIRKQKSTDTYQHAYLTSLVKENRLIEDSYRGELPDGSIEELGIVDRYVNQKYEDFSTREDLELTIEVDGIRIKLPATTFEGDFLVKDETDNTRVLSEAVTSILVDGIEVEVYGTLDRVISDDYRKTINFDKLDELRSTTFIVSIWDERGDFYYADVTDVENIDLPYKSHKWVLKKVRLDSSTSKNFSADFDVFFNEGELSDLKIKTLDKNKFLIDVENATEVPFYNYLAKIEGVVEDEDGVRPFSGYFEYYKID